MLSNRSCFPSAALAWLILGAGILVCAGQALALKYPNNQDLAEQLKTLVTALRPTGPAQ